MNSISWVSYIITFCSGGLAGAMLTRIFTIKDRAIKKLTLNIEEEEVKSIKPIIIEDKTYENLIYKKCTLKNSSKNDFPQLSVIFEFDKDSEIVKHKALSKKYGSNKFPFEFKKPSELVYHIQNFNRKQEVTFVFEVGNISGNLFCAVVDNCGVDIQVKSLSKITQPSISPSKIVDKLDLE